MTPLFSLFDTRESTLVNIVSLEVFSISNQIELLACQVNTSIHMLTRFGSCTGRQWQDLWEVDDYENDYYFVSQLFEQNWQPRTMG